MQRLQDKDSSEVHRAAMRFHLGRLQRFKTSLHVALYAEGKAAYDALKAAERARADLIDDEAEIAGGRRRGGDRLRERHPHPRQRARRLRPREPRQRREGHGLSPGLRGGHRP